MLRYCSSQWVEGQPGRIIASGNSYGNQEGKQMMCYITHVSISIQLASGSLNSHTMLRHRSVSHKSKGYYWKGQAPYRFIRIPHLAPQTIHALLGRINSVGIMVLAKSAFADASKETRNLIASSWVTQFLPTDTYQYDETIFGGR